MRRDHGRPPRPVPGITAKDIRWKLPIGEPPPLDAVRRVLSEALTLLYQRHREVARLQWTNTQLRQALRTRHAQEARR
jgi:hypothetical protein